MPERDPDKVADALDREAEKLERHSNEVQGQIEDARQDWERKRRDENVPGAPPPSPSEETGPVGADEEPPPDARREG